MSEQKLRDVELGESESGEDEIQLNDAIVVGTSQRAKHRAGSGQPDTPTATESSESDEETKKSTTVPDPSKPALKLPKAVTLKRLFAQAREERYIIAVATVALFVSAFANLAVPRYVGHVIDALGTGGSEGSRRLNAAALALVFIIIISAVFTFIRAFLYTYASERMLARLRRRLMTACLAQEIGFFDVTRTGELTNRFVTRSPLVLLHALTRSSAQSRG
jgi:ABC-type bacteriocin/lantibiotic exporter with double-glycine peptidase domain